jgi:hypothetical protein
VGIRALIVILASIAIIAIAVYFVAVPLVMSANTVEKHYFRKATADGTGHLLIDAIVNGRGQPIREETVPLGVGHTFNLVYDGYTYRFGINDDGSAHNYAKIIEITDPEYKIGFTKVGVGSSKLAIKWAYFFTVKIIGISGTDEIGFVDGSTWVVFHFADNKVDRIKIYRGP